MRRRDFLKTVSLGTAGIAGLGTFFSCSSLTKHKRPNLILINFDDLGWRDLACFGSSYYETPNIDRLASQGMKFTKYNRSDKEIIKKDQYELYQKKT